MCTVSWLHVDGGYELFCNRDERRSRLPALPPEVRELRGVRYVAPADGDFGGTWIGANECGISLCLLNRYDVEDVDPSRQYTSRGTLVLDHLDAPDPAAVRARLAAADLAQYQPFTLLVLTPGEPAMLARWSGRSLGFEDDAELALPLVSSGFDPAGVSTWRRALLFDGDRTISRLTPDRLAAFHRGHDPAAGPYSVCMHRDDAETVSFSRIRVRGDAVDFEYVPGAPCRGGLVARATLERAVIGTVG